MITYRTDKVLYSNGKTRGTQKQSGPGTNEWHPNLETTGERRLVTVNKGFSYATLRYPALPVSQKLIQCDIHLIKTELVIMSYLTWYNYDVTWKRVYMYQMLIRKWQTGGCGESTKGMIKGLVSRRSLSQVEHLRHEFMLVHEWS